ncbi:MAG TPA: hypothetical protein VN257_00300, partial [Actinotalea sp.]|nr:hypothetical protein [Actinotalea sp.]
LRTLAAGRGGLRPGEVVGLLVPVARALAVLHAAGLTHGDVAPANVVVGTGPPVLVDLVHGSDPGEHGTPGFAAPERPAGATPDGDVHALARLGLSLLGDGASSREDRAVEVRAVLDHASDPVPGRRGGADAVAQRLLDACPPEQVDLPEPAVLARLALRGLDRGPAGAVAGSAGVAAATVRRPRRGRHRRRLGRTVRPVVAGLAAVLVVGAWGMFGPWVPGRPAPVGAEAAVTDPGPVVAARLLTAQRTAALRSGDADALARVTVPGSPAARADLELLEVIERAGGAPDVVTVTTVARPGPADGPAAVCRGAGNLAGIPAAQVPGRLDAGSVRCATVVLRTSTRSAAGVRSAEVELVLLGTAAGWRVEQVRPTGP